MDVGVPVSLDTLDKWDAWVAIGTVMLAGATAWLAWSTRRSARDTRRLAGTTEEEVKAVRDQVELTREEVEAVKEQAEAAREQVAVSSRAVAAGVRPVLIAVPEFRDLQPGTGYLLEPLERVDYVDGTHADGIAVSSVDVHESPEKLYVSVPLRNAGEGIAFVEASGFRWAEGGSFSGLASSRDVPPGERTRLRFTQERSLEGVPDVAQLETYGTFSVEVSYADLAGGKWTTRLDVHREERTGRWFARQTHVGAQGEEPGVSSGPSA